MQTIHPKDSLQILPPDDRDLSHHKVFGTLGAGQIPNIDFDVSPTQVILQQFYSDFCTCFSATELNSILQGILSDPSLVDYLFNLGHDTSLSARAELAYAFGLVGSAWEYKEFARKGQNGAINTALKAILTATDGYPYFDPLWQFGKTKQVRGEYLDFGANLRDSMQSLRKYGSLLKHFSPYTYNEGKPTDKDRNFLANWQNWPKDLETKAAPFKIGSFWSVDGPLDIFDDIRSTLYKNIMTRQFAGVQFGILWREEWSNAPGGVIKDNYAIPEGGPHAIFIRGQKIINGIPYLVIQGSNGKGDTPEFGKQGDKGLFYFPRAIINREYLTGFGAYTAKDLELGEARYLHDNNIKINDNWVVGLAKSLFVFIKEAIANPFRPA